MSTSHDRFFRSEEAQGALWIDQLADQFEAAWQGGVAPDLAQFVSGESAAKRAQLLEELIRIDQAYRSLRGLPRTWDDYRAEFPELPLLAPSAADPSQCGCRPSEFASNDASARASETELPSGQALPRVIGYELVVELGRGSMGVVYKARQHALKRTVALKMILVGSFAGPEQLARFRLEAEAIARVQHPHIVQIYEVGEHEGLPFYVLEYVEGGSLSQKLGGVPQRSRRAAELIHNLALAVHVAHQHGIVHRDLKPANILMAADGTAKIADFGLAKQLDSDSGFTLSGVALGTPSYMAPEQAAGQAHLVTPTTDVYSLGAILYEMLTGRPPFRGATHLETLEQVRVFDLVRPAHLQPKLPRELETICLKALAKEPAQRYQTAEALADDLRRWLHGEPITARPVGPISKAVKWTRRRPAVAAALATAIAAVAFAAVGIWWHTRQLQIALTQADAARRQSDELRVASDTERERAEAMVYATDVRLAARAYAAGDVFDASRRLERHLPTSAQHDRREFTWKLLWSLCRPNEVVFRGHTQDAYAVRVIDGGQRIVSAGRDGTLRLWSVADPSRHEILKQYSAELNFVALAPDGVTLAVGTDDGTVGIWNIDRRSEIGNFVAHANWVLCGAISPQGDRLATGGRDNVIRIWSLDGKLQRELPGHTSTIESLVFLPDGLRLASTGTDQTVRLWDLASGAGEIIGTHPSTGYSVACSHDGRLLATGTQTQDIYLWDLASRTLRGRLAGHIESVQAVEFSPDDSRLASAGKDGSVRIWDLAGQTQIESFGGNTSRVWCVAWLPDGMGVVSSAGDGTLRLWRHRLDQLETPLAEMPDEVSRLLLRDSQRLAWTVSSNNRGYELCTQSGNQSPTVLRSPIAGRPSVVNWCAAQRADVLAVAWTNSVGPGVPQGPSDICLYDADGVRLPGSIQSKPGVLSLALNSDASLLTLGYRSGRLELYDLPSGRLRWTREGTSEEINKLEFRAPGDEIAAWTMKNIRVDAVSIADGRSRTVVEFKRPQTLFTAEVISPDGRHLVACGNEGIVRVWDCRSTNAEVGRLESIDGGPRALAFSSDGRSLAVGSGTGAVTLWHVPTWQELARFKTRLGTVLDLSFSPAGDTLGIAGRTPAGHGQILLWKTDSAASSIPTSGGN
ncbi:MAG: protein kinase [Pirellulales bacterium]|nr:protein kinase [Pirellulales bacterium]